MGAGVHSPRHPRCQDPSGDLLHDMCDSRYYGSVVQWFDGVSWREQATSGAVVQWGVVAKASNQWYSGSRVLCDDLL
jgi:hypothetical protein